MTIFKAIKRISLSFWLQTPKKTKHKILISTIYALNPKKYKKKDTVENKIIKQMKKHKEKILVKKVVELNEIIKNTKTCDNI